MTQQGNHNAARHAHEAHKLDEPQQDPNLPRGAMSVELRQGRVTIAFNKPIRALGLQPDHAVELAVALVKHARRPDLPRTTLAAGGDHE